MPEMLRDSSGGSGEEDKAPEEEELQFSGHSAYIVTVAKLCQQTEKFTDVNIQCKDGAILAHRLVLSSCSSFLRDVFLSLPAGLPEFTLIIPNIKKEVVKTLIDFLYTGHMMLHYSNTYDLQQLVHVLQIDPENVRIETPHAEKEQQQSGGSSRLVQSKITSMMKKSRLSATATTSRPTTTPSRVLGPRPKSAQQKAIASAATVTATTSNASSSVVKPSLASPSSGGPSSRASSNSTPSPSGSSVSSIENHPPNVAARPSPTVIKVRATTKRRASKESPDREAASPARGPATSSQPKAIKITCNPKAAASSSPSPAANNISTSSSPATPSSRGGRGQSSLRRRGRPRGNGLTRSSSASTSRPPPSGYHDMARVETWVCAICKKYDPVLPKGVKDPRDAPPTEWVGCDCNRWYHQHCTKLDSVDDDFSCTVVNLKCLPK